MTGFTVLVDGGYVTITIRQYACLYLYYCEGLSCRRIARRIGVGKSTVQRDLTRAVNALIQLDSQEWDTHPYIERLFSLLDVYWQPNGSRQEPRFDAMRDERLAQDLETALVRREFELDMIADCMSPAIPSQPNMQRSTLDHWELVYCLEHGVTTPSYEARSLHAFLCDRTDDE